MREKRKDSQGEAERLGGRGAKWGTVNTQEEGETRRTGLSTSSELGDAAADPHQESRDNALRPAPLPLPQPRTRN